MMEKMDPKSSRRSMLHVCIDNGGTDLTGRLESPLLGSEPFCGVFDMFRKMNAFFDSIQFPQKAFQTRSFLCASAQKKRRLSFIKEGENEMRESVVSEEQGQVTPYTQTPGQQATFMVHVMFRQNATWQGRIQWLEKGKKATFESALELVGLMEQALGEQGTSTAKTEWTSSTDIDTDFETP